MIVPSVQTVGATTLYALAAEAYGDATLWTEIARANGLVDPWLSDIITLIIPRVGSRQPTGGVLGG